MFALPYLLVAALSDLASESSNKVGELRVIPHEKISRLGKSLSGLGLRLAGGVLAIK